MVQEFHEDHVADGSKPGTLGDQQVHNTAEFRTVALGWVRPAQHAREPLVQLAHAHFLIKGHPRVKVAIVCQGHTVLANRWLPTSVFGAEVPDPVLHSTLPLVWVRIDQRRHAGSPEAAVALGKYHLGLVAAAPHAEPLGEHAAPEGTENGAAEAAALALQCARPRVPHLPRLGRVGRAMDEAIHTACLSTAELHNREDTCEQLLQPLR
mmetsp:Transcript_12028/g.30288  ORF Transcript_12028/g.30288 Transcript_12028/m.30288 type:complete len:209 (-) Transcript_12028:116-742(-)